MSVRVLYTYILYIMEHDRDYWLYGLLDYWLQVTDYCGMTHGNLVQRAR